MYAHSNIHKFSGYSLAGAMIYTPHEYAAMDTHTILSQMGQTDAAHVVTLPQIALSSSCAIDTAGSGLLASIIGNHHWVDDESGIGESESPSIVLARRYREYGTKCLCDLAGEFSLVIFDAENERLVLAVDRFSRQILHYSPQTEGIWFASQLGDLRKGIEACRELDAQGIYNYMYFHMVPSPGSIFRNVRKLRAGEMLIADGNGVSLSPYWKPEFRETHRQLKSELKQELRDKMRAAVLRSSEGKANLGAFLSGGLDSSTVAGMLAEHSDSPVQAFSIGFDAEGYDEMAYARLTAKHFGLQLNEYYVTPQNVVDALPSIAASYDEPFGNSSAIPTFYCAKLAAEAGVDTLIAGDGGDELFAGNERYAKQSVFERYGRLPRFLRRVIIEPFCMALPNTFAVAAKAKSYLRQANTPLPDRLQYYNYLNYIALEEIFCADFLASISTQEPLDIQRQVYNLPDGTGSLNRMLYMDWQFTLADNDLRKVNGMCELAGVDVRYPMLDEDLVNFANHLSSNLKLKRQDLRFFFKQAFAGWLPSETINKSKHGFGLPFGVWMRTYQPLQELAGDSLGALKKRGYFNPVFVDKVFKLHKENHAAYYGELIWIMMVLELWLSSHTDHS